MNPVLRKNKIGLPILFDFIPSVETVSVSFSVNTGSRDELHSETGISHFLEHMFFKGTKTRSAFDIANAIDHVGGYMNAYTSKQNTVYYIKLLKKDIEVAIEILADMIQNSVFSQSELDSERGVILQELYASMDDHDDVAFEMFSVNVFGDTPIGRNILGTKDSISNFQKEDLDRYIERQYSLSNCVLSFSGNFDEDFVLKLCDKYFISIKDTKKTLPISANYNSGFNVHVNKTIEQSKFILGFKAPAYKNISELYLSQISSNILSGGMSSRLFQEIREKRGLVYSIYSFNETYSDIGLLGIYAGTSHEKLDELSGAILSEMNRATEDIKQSEIEKTINQFSVSIASMLEDPVARGRKISKDFLNYGRFISLDEINEILKKITLDDIKRFIFSLIKQDPSILIYTNKEVDKSSSSFLNYFKS